MKRNRKNQLWDKAVAMRVNHVQTQPLTNEIPGFLPMTSQPCIPPKTDPAVLGMKGQFFISP